MRDEDAQTVNEADVQLGISSDVLNSTLDVGGDTPHQQVYGRNMPMQREIFDDVPEAATADARASDRMRRLLPTSGCRCGARPTVRVLAEHSDNPC